MNLTSNLNGSVSVFCWYFFPFSSYIHFTKLTLLRKISNRHEKKGGKEKKKTHQKTKPKTVNILVHYISISSKNSFC